MSNFNYDSITNIAAEPFMIKTGETYINAVNAAKNPVGRSPSEIALYSFNVKTGAAKVEVYRMPTSKVKPTFAAALVEKWYDIQYDAAYLVDDSLPPIVEGMDENEKAIIECVRKRIDLVYSVRNEHHGKHKPCKTVKNIAYAFAGAKESCFSEDVRNAYKRVKSELLKMRVNNKETLTVKEFKNLVTNVTKAVWDESEHCEYAFMKCHAAHAKDLYKLDYVGLRYNAKTKDFQPVYNKDGALINEIIRHAWQRILNNDANDDPNENATKPAEKTIEKNNK